MGPKQSDGSIACRVESVVLEPYFDGYSAVSIVRAHLIPSCNAARFDLLFNDNFIVNQIIAMQVELRKLSREDKDRSQRIVNQGSSQFIHDFSSLGQLQMKLLFTADEFFVKTSQASSNDWLADHSSPFLVVMKRN